MDQRFETKQQLLEHVAYFFCVTMLRLHVDPTCRADNYNYPWQLVDRIMAHRRFT